MKYAYALLLSLSLPGIAAAQSNAVSLSSQVKLEHNVTVGGQTRTELVEPKVVVPGDRLVFTINYRNASGKPVTDFAVTNPVPAAVRFGGQASPGAIVSVDGGRSWGQLAALKMKQADGTLRAAQPGDVTHLRWVLASAIAPGAAGTLSFRGTVR